MLNIAEGRRESSVRRVLRRNYVYRIDTFRPQSRRNRVPSCLTGRTTTKEPNNLSVSTWDLNLKLEDDQPKIAIGKCSKDWRIWIPSSSESFIAFMMPLLRQKNNWEHLASWPCDPIDLAPISWRRLEVLLFSRTLPVQINTSRVYRQKTSSEIFVGINLEFLERPRVLPSTETQPLFSKNFTM